MSNLITCYTENQIINNGGTIIQNSNGTISVYVNDNNFGLVETFLTKVCCETLRSGLTFDEKTQKCYWSKQKKCDNPFNIVLNPIGNDGAIFSVPPDETCTLSVEFDYLFKFSGSSLTEIANGTSDSTCQDVIDVFESIGASMSISTVKPTSTGVVTANVYDEVIFPIIGSGNLYNYLNGKSADTGFYVTCLTNNNQEVPINLYNLTVNNSPVTCVTPINQLVNSLFTESGLPQNTTGSTQFKTNVNENSFASNWLNASINITDPIVISAITNEKIKLNIRLSGICTDLCVLVDNIKLNKNCSHVSKTSIFVSQSPGFELDRIRDNKKSWNANTERTHRVFNITKWNNTSPIRYTDYYLDDYRQVINTKEIDLDISIAAAIETDVWSYISDNPCLITGTSIGTTTKSKEIFSAYTETQTKTGVSTTYSSVTATTVYTSVTSNTVTTSTNIKFCRAGLTLTPAGDECEVLISQQANQTGIGATIPIGNKLGVYGDKGAYFYPAVTTASALPYKSKNYNLVTGTLVDANNNNIAPIVINNTNTFWWSNNIDTLGRLNNVGLKALADTDPTNSGLAGWVGFSKCINIDVAGTYYVGLAADNYCRFKVNSTLIVEFDAIDDNTFRKWSVFPIQLNSGANFIEMEGLNGGGEAAFGAEIYNPTGATPFATLTAATSTASTQANVIFSTTEYVNQNWQLGPGGYSCQTGFVLNLCDPSKPFCTQVVKEPVQTRVQTNSVTTTGIKYNTATTYSLLTITAVTSSTVTVSLSACTTKDYCGSEYCGDAKIDIKNLLTQPLSSIKTIEDFQYYLTSELIDAKDRKTLSSYPTLRLLYDRYVNSRQYCNTTSAAFNYYTMNNFANLIGNYWVDLIEQVIPATTIWGSTRVYSNTIFDNQKFRYKSYSSFFGDNTFGSLKVCSSTSGTTCNTDVITTVVLGNASGTTLFTNQGNENKYSRVFLIQNNSGSEFVGSVTSTGKNSPCGNGSINNCDLDVRIEDNTTIDGTIKAIPVLPIGNVMYNWVTPTGNYTTQSVTATTSGTYTVTINDDCCEATASFNRGECLLSVTLTATNPNTGQNDGSIIATPSGQVGAVTYLWSDGQTTQTASNLSAGTYNVTVKDSIYDNCTASAETSIYETSTLRAINLTGASIYIISATTAYDIEWGDGVISAYTAGYNFMYPAQSHIYAPAYSPYNGNITLRSFNLGGIKSILTDQGGPTGSTGAQLAFTGPQLSRLTGLTLLNNIKTSLSANTTELPRNLTNLSSYIGKMTGNIGNFPTGMTVINLTTTNETNTLSGNTSGLPRNLKTFVVLGNNTISGSTTGLPTGLTTMELAGFNTISGDSSGFPRTLTVLSLRGNATPSGSIANLPTGATSFNFACFDTFSGDVSTITGITGLTSFVVENSLASFPGNTITGDINNLRKSISTLNIAGSNTLYGNIANMPTGSTGSFAGYFNIRGVNTISGNTANISTRFSNFILGGVNTLSGSTYDIPTNVAVMLIGGNNKISGDLDGLAHAQYIDIGGLNTITKYTGGTWASGMNRVKITGNTSGFTTLDTDLILNNLTATTWNNTTLIGRFGKSLIGFKGTGSTASLAARQKLTGSTASGGFNVTLDLT
jgi:hypothetical protein